MSDESQVFLIENALDKIQEAKQQAEASGQDEIVKLLGEAEDYIVGAREAILPTDFQEGVLF